MRSPGMYFQDAIEGLNRTEAPTRVEVRSRAKKTLQDRRLQLGRLLQDQFPNTVQKIVATSRLLIIEGISGSGKDTLQRYLKSRLRNRIVHDYSEGELLWSWKHQRIKSISKMQVQLMTHFLEYVRETLATDNKALFVLNRFHLSTYTMYQSEIDHDTRLRDEYSELIEQLRQLPTHIFLLQLLPGEMELRSAHPERGVAWRKFQRDILTREGFGNFVERNIALQQAMVRTAVKQEIPFSTIRLPSLPNFVPMPRSADVKGSKLDTALDPVIAISRTNS